MGGFIARRLLQGLLLLVLVATVVFFLGRLTGNPVDLMLPEDATAEDRARLIEALGLDGSLFTQYVAFIGSALQGDLGTSLRMRQPAVDVFLSRLPNTLAIIPWALLLAMLGQSSLWHGSCQSGACRIKKIGAGGGRHESPAPIFFMHLNFSAIFLLG